MQIVSKRSEFERIKKQLTKLGKGNARLTQSSLILIQPMDATKRNYQFPVLETEAPVNNGEIRLNINDEFIVTEIGYYLAAQVTTPAPNATQAPILLSYAPIEIGTLNNQYNNAFAGTLKIDVNNVRYMEKWDLAKHLFVPRNQFQNTSAGIPAAMQPSGEFKTIGLADVVPMIVFSGAKKNTIEISLASPVSPSSFTFTNADGIVHNITINRIVVGFRGLLAQNASKFQGVGAPE